ncbi:MAG: phage holin family protein [Flavobacteriales bacterium]|nr:phage holin family protein [Flavobacteriales bacterium]
MLARILLSSIAVAITAWLLPGVHLVGLLTTLLVAVFLSVVNNFVKPILILLTLPITVFTLGLFLLVINAWMVLWASDWINGFQVDGFWWALGFSLVLSVVNSLLGVRDRDKPERRYKR